MKETITIILVVLPIAIFSQDTSLKNDSWSFNLLAAIIGGLIGGILGVIGTLWTSYYGPKKLIEFKEKREEEKLNGPRKKLLLKLLKDSTYQDGRKLETLSMVTGTTFEECRRLLVEVGARGVKLSGNVEGWVLIEKKPIIEE